MPLNHESTSGELLHALRLSEPQFLAMAPGLESAVAEAAGEVGIEVVMAGDGFRPPQPGDPASGSGPGADTGPETECAMLFTSGSTGPPKGCILNNSYFTRIGEWYAAVGGLCDLTPGEE